MCIGRVAAVRSCPLEIAVTTNAEGRGRTGRAGVALRTSALDLHPAWAAVSGWVLGRRANRLSPRESCRARSPRGAARVVTPATTNSDVEPCLSRGTAGGGAASDGVSEIVPKPAPDRCWAAGHANAFAAPCGEVVTVLRACYFRVEEPSARDVARDDRPPARGPGSRRCRRAHERLLDGVLVREQALIAAGDAAASPRLVTALTGRRCS